MGLATSSVAEVLHFLSAGGVKRRVLITGGAGFIGSHLVDGYLAADWDVFVLDDLSSGKEANFSAPTRIQFLKGDIRDPKVRSWVAEIRPDVINHHAAQKSVRHSVEDPVFDADENVLGLVNMLEAGRLAGCKDFILASSGGAIYGEQEYFPADEAHPTRPLSPYGASKLCGEVYLKLYTDLHGFRTTALRYANVYGPRQDPQGEAGVVAIFCERLLKGEPLVVYGTGEQTRDFVYVEDLARINLACSDVSGSPYFRVLNVGTQIETSILQMIKTFEGFLNRKIEIRFEAPRMGEQMRSCVSQEQCVKLLSGEQIQMQEGLRRTFEFFQRELSHRK